jgi:predicted nucleotidyltransferase
MDRILKEKRQEILRIAAMYGGRNVRVFGSRARDEARPGSDFDFLLDLDSDRSLLDIVAIKQDLEDMLGRQVDVLTEAAISPYLREDVLKEAVRL